jgi:ferric-dicitrate binding protein FerR (iron transport regulator)
MNIENDQIYDLIAKSFLGELTEEENVSLLTWKSSDESNTLEYNDFKEIWKHSNRLAMPSQIDLPKSLSTTRKKAGINVKNINLLPRFAQIAAVLVLAILISALYNLFLVTKPNDKNKTIVNQQVRASFGTQSRVVLADGTVVYLNSGSTLKFPNSFDGMKNRNVELTGEGSFEVAKISEQPFIVDIHNIQIKVLGTKFTVDAYPNNSSFIIALIEGSIQLQQKNGTGVTDLIEMKPNQVANYNLSENKLLTNTEEDLTKYTAWTEGKIVLSNDPVNTVIQKLENWYNVDIELSDKKLEKYRFTGTFIEEPLEQVLRILNLTSHMRYTIIPAKKLGDNSYSKRKIILKSK